MQPSAWDPRPVRVVSGRVLGTVDVISGHAGRRSGALAAAPRPLDPTHPRRRLSASGAHDGAGAPVADCVATVLHAIDSTGDQGARARLLKRPGIGDCSIS